MNEILKLAWRNLWRNRRRTLITLAAGCLGLMLAQGYTNLARGIWTQMINDGVRYGSGHVGLYAQGYKETREPALVFDGRDLPERLRRLEGVRAVLPRLYLPGLAQSARGSRGAIILGIQPSAEWAVNPLARALKEGRLIGDDTLREAVIGRVLLEALKLKVGSKFVVMVQSASGDIGSEMVRVAGVLDTGLREVDAGTVFVSLKFAGLLSGREGSIHEAAVILDEARRIPRALAAVRALPGVGSKVEALPWDEAMPELSSHVNTDLFSLRIIIAFIYLIIGIGIVNTLLMSVMERSREFGVMLALGVPTRFLLGMVAAEGAVMGLLAATSGTLLGSGVTAALVHWGLDLSKLYASSRIEVSGVVFSSLVRARWAVPDMIGLAVAVFLVYALAAVYPARKAAMVKPVVSMKYT